MFVTAKLLKKFKACDGQLRKFAVLFPDGVELSRTVIVNHAQEFDWRWCVENLASDAGRGAYWQAEEQAQAVYWQAIEPSWAAYNQAIAQAWAVFQQAFDQAEAAYDQAFDQAMAAYLEARKPALDVYQQTDKPAQAAYNLARANAFADAMGL